MNFDGNTALHLASISEQLEVIKFLVGNGANAMIKNNNNQTPLDTSRLSYNPPITDYLNSIINTQQVITDATCACRI